MRPRPARPLRIPGTAKDSSHLGIDIGRVDHMQDGVVGVLAVGLGQTRTDALSPCCQSGAVVTPAGADTSTAPSTKK